MSEFKTINAQRLRRHKQHMKANGFRRISIRVQLTLLKLETKVQ